jgi:NAD(P)-dependent dehydrogenase (short-subunit alcohol dehydrogenase family)
VRLDNKVAVVTGSGRGLGRAYAEALAAAGAAVVVNDIDGDVAAETAAAITAAGGRAVAEVCAVGTAESADALVQRAVSEFGRLDVMCANAGALRDRTLTKVTDEEFDLVVNSHVRGTFTCARAAVRRFREQGGGGRLILVGSPAGQYGGFGQTAYAASKAAIIAMVRVWSVETAKHGVTVNAIVPTALTRMAATIPALADVVAAVDAGAPVPADLRRRGIGTAADAASLVVYLASDEAAGVNGQYIGFGGDRLSIWGHPKEVFVTHRDGGWSPDQLAADFAGLAEHLQSHAPPRS